MFLLRRLAAVRMRRFACFGCRRRFGDGRDYRRRFRNPLHRQDRRGFGSQYRLRRSLSLDTGMHPAVIRAAHRRRPARVSITVYGYTLLSLHLSVSFPETTTLRASWPTQRLPGAQRFPPARDLICHWSARSMQQVPVPLPHPAREDRHLAVVHGRRRPAASH